jgi:hypothetical protein
MSHGPPFTTETIGEHKLYKDFKGEQRRTCWTPFIDFKRAGKADIGTDTNFIDTSLTLRGCGATM